MRSITLVSFVFFALSGSKVLGASFDLERLRASSSQGINETDFTGKDTVIARLPVMDQIDFNMNEAIQGAALHLDKVLLLEKSSHSDALVSELKNLKTQLISDFERDLIKLAGQGRLPGSKSGTFEIQQFTKLVQEKWSQTAINDLGKWKDSTLARWTQETMTFWRSKKMQLMESLHKDEVSSTCVIGPCAREKGLAKRDQHSDLMDWVDKKFDDLQVIIGSVIRIIFDIVRMVISGVSTLIFAIMDALRQYSDSRSN